MTAPPTDEPGSQEGHAMTGEVAADKSLSVQNAQASDVTRAEFSDTVADVTRDSCDVSRVESQTNETENIQLDLPALVSQYESPLLRYAGQLLRPNDSEIEDIVQDAFLRLHKQVCQHGDQSVSHPGTWLYKVTRNLVMDTLRKRKVRNTGGTRIVQEAVDAGLVDGLSENSDGADTLGDLEYKEACDHALAELQKLPHKQKEAVLLKVHG
jgi:RNA polymerase sigma factor (sigma-70 family)